MTTSEFACRALGIESAGSALEKGAGCMFCARRLEAGDPGVTFEPSKNFMDAPSLAHRADPGTLCGDCAALATKPIMMATQNCVVTATGAFSLASSAAKRHLLLHPPPPPFALCLSDTTLQHLLWRTPLTLSHEIVYLRISSRLFRMNLPRVRQGHEIVLSLRQRAGFSEQNSPLLSLDYHWRSLTNARLLPAVEACATTEELRWLYHLSPGEWWGLGVLLLPVLAQPPPKILIGEPVGSKQGAHSKSLEPPSSLLASDLAVS